MGVSSLAVCTIWQVYTRSNDLWKGQRMRKMCCCSSIWKQPASSGKWKADSLSSKLDSHAIFCPLPLASRKFPGFGSGISHPNRDSPFQYRRKKVTLLLFERGCRYLSNDMQATDHKLKFNHICQENSHYSVLQGPVSYLVFFYEMILWKFWLNVGITTWNILQYLLQRKHLPLLLVSNVNHNYFVKIKIHYLLRFLTSFLASNILLHIIQCWIDTWRHMPSFSLLLHKEVQKLTFLFFSKDFCLLFISYFWDIICCLLRFFNDLLGDWENCLWSFLKTWVSGRCSN